MLKLDNKGFAVWRSLLVVGLVALTCTCSCRKESEAPEKTDQETRSTRSNASRARRIDRLRSLPYVGASEQPTDPNLSGLMKLQERWWSPGYTLYNGRNYCAAELLDLKGEVFHVWQVEGRHWDACELTSNGDLLVVGSDVVTTSEAPVVDEARYLLRLSWDRKLLWKRKMFAHHDVDVTPDDRIVVVTFKNEPVAELGRDDARVDYLTMLSADGELIAEQSLYQAFQSNPDEFTFQPVGARSTGPEKRLDPFHTNSVEWMHHEHLYDRHPIYASTNVLVCTRHQDVIAIINWDTNKLIWAWGPGEIQGPHDAQVLANGNILLFDNGLWRKWSRVIELDPLTKKIVWEYRALNPTDFYTRSGGGCQRLPNGNTLITNSDEGHGFEVTADGEIVWEFYNPKFTTSGKRISCARMKRYQPGFIEAIQEQH